MAAATQGWASCSNNARPAPRNIAASLSICHIIELGPNTPTQLSAAASQTIASSLSSSAPLTIRDGPREALIAAPAIRKRRLVRHQNRYRGAAQHVQGKPAKDPFAQAAAAVAAHH